MRRVAGREVMRGERAVLFLRGINVGGRHRMAMRDLRAVLDDLGRGVPIGQISGRFHNALAELAVAIAQRVALPRVVLSGGCFQNALLSRRTSDRLRQAGFEVFTHRQVPPGDGGIALGQIYVAAHQMTER